MKIKYRLFFSIILVVSLGCFVSGSLFLYSNFRESLHSRVEQANQEHHTFKYFYELHLIGEAREVDDLSDEILTNAAASITEEFSWNHLSLCVSREGEKGIIHLYSNLPTRIGRQDLLDTIGEESKGKIVRHGQIYDLLITTPVTHNETVFFFTTVQDISPVYENLTFQNRSLLLIWTGMLIPLGVTALAAAKSFSHRIEYLEEIAQRISNGAYVERTHITGSDEISRLGESFNRMADSVEEKMKELQDYAKSRDDFARNFSHELKTPLTSIIGYADLLRSRKGGEETVWEAARYIYREGKRLEVLSQRLLELMKLRQTCLKLNVHPLEPILSRLQESTAPLFCKSKVTLVVPFCGGSAAFDPPLLLALLTNLVNNGCSACEAGGVVEITLEEQKNRWVISVRDNGRGIPAEDLPRLTEEFYQVDKARSGSNTGLGLSICQEIARLHGGGLSITSIIGEGTTVSFPLNKEVLP